MPTQIVFNPNKDKILEGLVWIANERPGLTRYYFVKIMYLAEKLHLQKYGRPIYGDPLYALEFGPVPTITYDLVKEDFSFRTEDMADAFYSALSVSDKLNGHKAFTAKRSPDLDWFSASDIECMREAFDAFANLPFAEIMNQTHREPEWRAAGVNGKIDYEKILDDGTEDSQKTIARLAEQGRYIAL